MNLPGQCLADSGPEHPGCSGLLEPVLWLPGKPVRENSKEEKGPLLESSSWTGCQTLPEC